MFALYWVTVLTVQPLRFRRRLTLQNILMGDCLNFSVPTLKVLSQKFALAVTFFQYNDHLNNASLEKIIFIFRPSVFL